MYRGSVKPRTFHSGSANPLDGNIMFLCGYEHCSGLRLITPGGLLYNGGRELYNEELHGLYSAQNILSTIKLKIKK
jgi:hypothetical protein